MQAEICGKISRYDRTNVYMVSIEVLEKLCTVYVRVYLIAMICVLIPKDRCTSGDRLVCGFIG